MLPFPSRIDGKIILLGSERSCQIRSADTTWIFVFQLLSLQEMLAIRRFRYHACAEDVWSSCATPWETSATGLCVEMIRVLPNVGTVIKYSFGMDFKVLFPNACGCSLLYIWRCLLSCSSRLMVAPDSRLMLSF